MQKWSIGRKMGASFTGLAVCILVLGLVALWAVNSLREELEQMGGVNMRKIEIAGALDAASKGARAEMRGIVLAASLKRAADLQKAQAGVQRELAEFESLLTEVRPLLTDDRAKAAAATLTTTEPQWKEAIGQMAGLAAAGKVDEANKVRIERIAPQSDVIEASALTLRAVQKELATARVKESNQRAAASLWWIGGCIVVGMALSLLVLRLVRNLVNTLRETVEHLSVGGEQVASASGEIASASQTLSQGSVEQAASIEEISASMEEMTAMARRSSDNSTQASSMMSEAVTQVGRSNSALADMVASMSSIKESSEKVAKINKIIDEIAFQTNILALNAAVEAARAGEAGMGFAVVAEEVRNLAQRSAAAARDTAVLIDESLARASEGAANLDLVSVAIRAITGSAGEVKSLLDELNESSKQQGLGIQQASSAISQVSVVTQTAAASAEESAAAAEELNAQSATVRDLVHTLTVIVEGVSAGERLEIPASRRPSAPRGSGDLKPHEARRTTSEHFPVETSGFRDF